MAPSHEGGQGHGAPATPPPPTPGPLCPPHLRVPAQLLENVVDLVLEAPTQHLVSLVQHEHLDELGGWGGGAGVSGWFLEGGSWIPPALGPPSALAP